MTTPISGIINGLEWNGDYWLAYGQTPNIALSYDGIIWTSTKTNFSVVSDIKWNGTLWVAVGFILTSNSSPYPGLINYSTNGKTWTNATTDITTLENAQGWALLAVGIQGSDWLAVGYCQNSWPITLTSTNGTSWVKKTNYPQPKSGIDSTLLSFRPTILWNGNSFVLNAPFVRGDGGTLFSGNPLVQNEVCGVFLTNLIFSNGIYLGIGQKAPYVGSPSLYYSTNLTSQFQNIIGKTGLSSTINDIVFNGITHLVYDLSGNVAINTAPSRTSNWTKQTDNAKKLTFIPTKISWFSPFWLATDSTNTAKSSDGITWVNQTLRMNNPVYNGHYLLSYTGNRLERLTLWEKKLGLHSPPSDNSLNPIYINLYGNPITTLTEITLNTPFIGMRLRLENIVNNTTGRILVQQQKTPTNTNLKLSTVILSIKKRESIKFGLIVLEYRKNGKWYTLSYLKNKTHLI